MKKNELKLGALLSYAVIILNMVVGLAYTPLVIRLLGQSEYGLYSLVSSVISYLTVLDMGFGNAIIVYTARYRAKKQVNEEQNLYGMFLIINTIIGIVAAFIGIALYFNVEIIFGSTMSSTEISKAKIMMLILTFNLAITFPLSIFGNILTAYEKFIFNKIVKIINIVLQPILMIPLLLCGFKSITLVIILTVVNIFCLLLNVFACFKKVKIKIKFSKFNTKLLKEIFAYSFFIFLAEIINKVNFSLDQFILGAVQGTATVAIYSAASQINSMYMAFSTAISGVMLPKVTKMEENGATNEEFSKLFLKTGRIQLLIIMLILTGFCIFGQRFFLLWAGKGYEESYLIACLLMIPMTIPLIQNVGLSILQAKNKYKYRTIILFGIAIMNIIISIPLAKLYSGIGSAIGTAISLIIGQGIILNWYYHKKIKINIKLFWKEIIKMTLPLLMLFTISFYIISLLGKVSLPIYFIEIIIYSILYCVIAWLFSMNNYEKDIVLKPVNKLLKKH